MAARKPPTGAGAMRDARADNLNGISSWVSHADVPWPVARVWAVIGDFGAVRRWATHVTAESVFQTGGAPLRVLHHADGSIIREELVRFSGYAYGHRLLDRPELGDLVGTVAATALDGGYCRIILTSGTDIRLEDDWTALATRVAQSQLRDLQAMTQSLQIADCTALSSLSPGVD
jgi:hypothetical protein